ncbi:hypothetical protein ABK54_004879, partial [Salmonella enterica subsp. enterica serovar Shubra]|nr:hypothetical protein [Salmonella enterica subsp. enterica serovar Shubra]
MTIQNPKQTGRNRCSSVIHTHKAARQVLKQSQAPKITVTRACQFLG